MPIQRFDHVNVRTANLESMIAFYTEVLGLTVGPRPNFGFPGAWLYCGGLAVVHLVGVSERPVPYAPDQQLEHFAFAADDFNGFLMLLEEKSLPYRLLHLDDVGITQCNIHDPDGNHIHVDFTDA